MFKVSDKNNGNCDSDKSVIHFRVSTNKNNVKNFREHMPRSTD